MGFPIGLSRANPVQAFAQPREMSGTNDVRVLKGDPNRAQALAANTRSSLSTRHGSALSAMQAALSAVSTSANTPIRGVEDILHLQPN